MIAVETVLMARELIKASTEEQFDEWISWFFDTQPDVLDFIVERTRGRTENICELALFLALFIFKAYDLEHPGKTVTPSRADLAVALDQMTDWMRRLGGDGFADSHRETEPFLLIFVVKELEAPLDDGTALDQLEKDELLGIAKTVILALELAARRQGAGAS
jgi:hypothetical protein